MDHLAVGFFHFLLSTEPSQLSRDITRKSTSNTTLQRPAIAQSKISFCRLRHILSSKMKDRQNDGRKGVIFREDVLQMYTSQEEFFAVKSSSHLSLKTNNSWKTN